MIYEDWMKNTYEKDTSEYSSLDLRSAWNQAIRMALDECYASVKFKKEGISARGSMDIYSRIKQLLVT